MRDDRDRSVGDVDTIDRAAFVEAPADDRIASAEVGVLADPARAQDTAVADFQQTAFEVITHDRLPQSCRSSTPPIGAHDP